MFVGVVALRYQHYATLCCVVLITERHNSHKHSQSPLTNQCSTHAHDDQPAVYKQCSILSCSALKCSCTIQAFVSLGVALAILGPLGIITKINLASGDSLDAGTVAAGWQNFLICIEMLLGSIALR